MEAAWRLARILCYVDAVLLPVLALNGLHLIFEAEFQLLQTNFFQLLVFAEVTLLGECIEAFRILSTGQKLVQCQKRGAISL